MKIMLAVWQRQRMLCVSLNLQGNAALVMKEGGSGFTFLCYDPSTYTHKSSKGWYWLQYFIYFCYKAQGRDSVQKHQNKNKIKLHWKQSGMAEYFFSPENLYKRGLETKRVFRLYLQEAASVRTLDPNRILWLKWCYGNPSHFSKCCSNNKKCTCWIILIYEVTTGIKTHF